MDPYLQSFLPIVCAGFIDIVTCYATEDAVQITIIYNTITSFTLVHAKLLNSPQLFFTCERFVTVSYRELPMSGSCRELPRTGL
jgi:hypothetical protein